MSCKDILVHYDDSPAGKRRLETAARLAAQRDAHLTALVLDVAPSIVAFADTGTPVWVLDELGRTAAETLERVTTGLDALLARQAPGAERRIARCAATSIGTVLAQHARYADLLVLGQPAPSEPATVGREAVEDILLTSGRPVLLVPYVGAGDTVGKRVLVAWDGGREAARAVHDAMSFIETAQSVTVLAANGRSGRGAPGDIPGADIALHLARHGVPVEVVTLHSNDLAVADLALNWMAEHGTDLLVMGAYGHSRMRELVLGGMTRSILDRMTVPVLMAH